LVIYDGQIEANGYHTTYTLSPQLRTLLSSTYNLSSAIGWFPGLPLVIFGAILMQMKRKERAAKIFKKVTTLVPQGAPAWRLYAQSLHALERYDEAEVAYRQSIRCDPQYPGAYLWLSFLLKESERHDEAEEILKQLIKQKPSAYYTYLLLGMYVQERGRLTDAEQLFEKAIKLNPKDAGSYTLLGGNLLEQKRLIEAEEVLLKALKLKHKKSDIRPLYNAFGDAYMEQRELDKARSYFNKRIQLEPKTAFDALVSLGIIAYFEGDQNDDGYFLRALDIWDVSWKVQRQTPAGLLENKALALACLDRQEEALQALEEAISRWSWEDVVELHRYELLLDTPNPPEGIEKMVNTLRTLALEHNPGQ
jgi:superkiller protein 3